MREIGCKRKFLSPKVFKNTSVNCSIQIINHLKSKKRKAKFLSTLNTNSLLILDKDEKFKDALVQADILTKHKIKNKQINFICGELFLSFRLYKKALFSLAYSIKLDPNFYMAYKLLGITEYSLGNFNKALKIYNAAKKLNNLEIVEAVATTQGINKNYYLVHKTSKNTLLKKAMNACDKALEIY